MSQHTAAPSGPVLAAQLDQLLAPSLSLSVIAGSPLFEYDMQDAMWVGADPAECRGATSYGQYPLFPTDYTGREARTQVDNAHNQHQLLEVSATYPSDFDAGQFLDGVRKAVQSCQRPVTVWGDDQVRYSVTPGPLLPGSEDMVRWTTSKADDRWVCEFATIAKANVISQVVTCSPDRSIDNRALADARLAKIESLLTSVA